MQSEGGSDAAPVSAVATTTTARSRSGSSSNDTNNSNSLSYALRRVFSTDARATATDNEEAQGLIPAGTSLSHRVSSHVLEREEGAELILDHELLESNASVANAMLDEHRQVNKSGGYQLRKFLSTPHYNNNNNNNDHANTASSMRVGNKGGGGLRSSVLRRAPSYDPNVSFDDDDEFHDNYVSTSSSSTSHRHRHGHDNEDESPLFRIDDDVEVSLTDHSTTTTDRKLFGGSRPRSQSSTHEGGSGSGGVLLQHSLEQPVPFNRNPLSFRRKTSDLATTNNKSSSTSPSSFRKEDHHPDDLSTVAESVTSSSNNAILFDHDLKKGGLMSGTSKYNMMKYQFSLRRSIILTAIVLVVCSIGVAVFNVLGKEEDTTVTANQLKTMTVLEGGGVKVTNDGADDDDAAAAADGSGDSSGNNQFGSNNEEQLAVDDAAFALVVDDGDVSGGNIYNNNNSGNTNTGNNNNNNNNGNNNDNNNGNNNDNNNGNFNGNANNGNNSNNNSGNNNNGNNNGNINNGNNGNNNNNGNSNSNNSPSAVSNVVPVPSENTGTIAPTNAPTSGTYTKFYIMADCPYVDNERENLMPGYIEDLSSDAAFLFHLGDLQYAAVDKCEEWAYESASSILKKSPIPTFVIPGDNDMNDCPDHEHGEDMWKQYFHKIDEYWEHDFALTRWGKLDESFSFLHKGVLYFGLNVVGGDPYSQSEAEARYAVHLTNIRSILNGFDEEDFKVIVVLAHADPTYSSHHEEFFESLAETIEKVGKPTIHFNGDYHEYYETEGGEYDVDNYMRITLDGESISPPIRVEIDVSKKNPITVDRRRDDLYVDCCSDGWPWIEEEL